MEGLRHPLTQENKTIGEILAHRRKRYHGVKNPLRGSLLERRIQRAIYCVENDVDKEFTDWFIADTGMQPQEFLDKWSKKIRHMKRLICLVGILGIGLALAGCSDNDNKANAADKETSLTDQLSSNDYSAVNFNNIRAKIVTDPDTGVEYIETYVVKEKGSGVSVTPRLTKDGKPYVNPKWWKNK